LFLNTHKDSYILSFLESRRHRKIIQTKLNCEVFVKLQDIVSIVRIKPFRIKGSLCIEKPYGNDAIGFEISNNPQRYPTLMFKVSKNGNFKRTENISDVNKCSDMRDGR